LQLASTVVINELLKSVRPITADPAEAPSRQVGRATKCKTSVGIRLSVARASQKTRSRIIIAIWPVGAEVKRLTTDVYKGSYEQRQWHTV